MAVTVPLSGRPRRGIEALLAPAMPAAPALVAGQYVQLLALVDQACRRDLPVVRDPQASFQFGGGTTLRAPRPDEITVHSALEPGTAASLVVVVGPCETAAVYRDGVLLGLAKAGHPQFLADLRSFRFSAPLCGSYRVGDAPAPTLQLIHRT